MVHWALRGGLVIACVAAALKMKLPGAGNSRQRDLYAFWPHDNALSPPVTTLLAVAATWAAMKLRDKNKEEAALKETTKAPSSSSQAGGDMRQPKKKRPATLTPPKLTPIHTTGMDISSTAKTPMHSAPARVSSTLRTGWQSNAGNQGRAPG